MAAAFRAGCDADPIVKLFISLNMKVTEDPVERAEIFVKLSKELQKAKAPPYLQVLASISQMRFLLVAAQAKNEPKGATKKPRLIRSGSWP